MTDRKVMIVTGASRGIGAATALLAAREGYAVCINYAGNTEAADSVVASIRYAGGEAIAVRGDVSNEADVEALFAATDEAFGRLDCLVNNAGIVGPQARLDEIDRARFERILAVNVLGPHMCCRAAIGRMSTKHGGRGGAIVNLSSIAARLGSPNTYIDYAASKGAIDTLTTGLAREVANEGIRVNAVRPGFIYTDIHASSGEAGRVDRLKEIVPMRRGGEAEEIAEAVVWLASDKAAYVTGAFIDVSGGM